MEGGDEPLSGRIQGSEVLPFAERCSEAVAAHAGCELTPMPWSIEAVARSSADGGWSAFLLPWKEKRLDLQGDPRDGDVPPQRPSVSRPLPPNWLPPWQLPPNWLPPWQLPPPLLLAPAA